jgi:hypothetical protein
MASHHCFFDCLLNTSIDRLLDLHPKIRRQARCDTQQWIFLLEELDFLFRAGIISLAVRPQPGRLYMKEERP